MLGENVFKEGKSHTSCIVPAAFSPKDADSAICIPSDYHNCQTVSSYNSYWSEHMAQGLSINKYTVMGRVGVQERQTSSAHTTEPSGISIGSLSTTFPSRSHIVCPG